MAVNGPIAEASLAVRDAEVRLPVLLDLTAAEPLCQTLRERLEDGDLLLDGSEVARITTPCLQVMAAAATTCRARGYSFRLRRASPVLSAAIADLGLTTALPIGDQHG